MRLDSCIQEEIISHNKSLTSNIYQLFYSLKLKQLFSLAPIQMAVILLQFLQYNGYLIDVFLRNSSTDDRPQDLLKLSIDILNLNLAHFIEPVRWFVLLLLTNFGVVLIIVFLFRIALKKVTKLKEQRKIEIHFVR